MSIKGFQFGDGAVQKYDFEALENIPVPDTTLSQAGAAADAKKTGDEIADLKSAISQGTGLTNEAKQALLDCFAHVAWIDEDGQDYYDALESALYPPANLTSITAVFTQGQAVIYDSDTLDDLKQYLVVTAHYSDSTSAVVTAYTLSGTLATGTSTITAAYGGKTATFFVTVTDANALPTGYTKYDYIKNTTYDLDNNSNDIIDLGVNSTYCDSEYIHEIVAKVPSDAKMRSTSGIYGCRPATGSAGSAKGVSLWMSANNVDKIAVAYNGVDSGYTLNFSFGEKHTVKLETGHIYIDNTLVGSPIGSRTSFDTSSFRLFGVATNEDSYGGSHMNVCIYSVKIKDSITGNAIANFVPCKNASAIPGVYDTVNNTFHYAVNYSKYSVENEVVQ